MESNNDIIRDKIWMAPMVRGSELSFRNLVRQQGLRTPCFSPMVRAEHVVNAFECWERKQQPHQQQSVKQTMESQELHEDGLIFLHDIMVDTEPLVVQLCGCSPESLYQSCRILLRLNQSPYQCQIVGLDFNLGCPQQCAQNETFGAFLADEKPRVALECVAAMRQAIDEVCYDEGNPQVHKTSILSSSAMKRPRLSCKIRLRDTTVDTLQFAKRLSQQGCELLIVHCRRRKDRHDGMPDYEAGVDLVAALHHDINMPVVINGDVTSVTDAKTILGKTKAHAVMIARGFLCNPLLLSSMTMKETLTTRMHALHTPLCIAAMYIDQVEKHPPPSSLYIRGHLRWIFRSALRPYYVQKDHPDNLHWKGRIYNFLARPYLVMIVQFRSLLGMYARYMIKEEDFPDDLAIPPSLSGYMDASFHDIRYGYVKSDIEDSVPVEGLAMGLFD